MPIRDRTISDNLANFDTINTEIAEISERVDNLENGVHFVGEYSTYAVMIATLTNPQDSDWVFITQDETYSNLRTQYIYNNGWKYAGGQTNINDATNTIKGVIKLTGDLSGTANNPQLSSIIDGGIYNFGNNIVTFDTKGRLINVDIGTSATEWTFKSLSETRTEKTNVFTVPTYNTDNAFLMFYYNGLLIPETDCYLRTNSTTITTKFDVNIDDDIIICNMRFIGKLSSNDIISDTTSDTTITYSSSYLNNNFARIDNNIIPKTTETYNIGSSTFKYDTIYLKTAPIVTSDSNFKNDIKPLEINALEFINNLETKQYKLNGGNRVHTGLLSNQLKDTLDNFNVDYAMYIKDLESGNEAIRYEELIPILIQAVKNNTSWYKKLYYKIKNAIRKRGENK